MSEVRTAYEEAIRQIDTADISGNVYRTARRLLDLAAQHDGYIELTPAATLTLCATEADGTMRSHLDQLRLAGIITYSISNKHSRVIVHFSAYPWPVVDAWPEPPRVAPTNSRAAPADLLVAPENSRVLRANFLDSEGANLTEPDDCWPSQQICRDDQQICWSDQQIRAQGARSGTGVTTTNKQTNSNTPDHDQGSLFVPPIDWPPERVCAGQFVYSLLTDEEVGLWPESAAAAARLHPPAWVVAQVAEWWCKRDKLKPGALFTRLMDPERFRSGPPGPEFLSSDLYRRHYPLDEDDVGRWERWQKYGGEYADLIQGLDPPAMPPEVEDLVRQLPLPKGGVP